jgi:single-strand DNA-binding protein
MATRAGSAAKPAASKQSTSKQGSSKVGQRKPARAGEHRNEVMVCGRLGAAALPKQLPSGDEISTWRLVVDRPPADGTRKVDVVDCTTFGARVRRQALAWAEGDLIEVTGALRRRFWRSAGGLQSRCEVEVSSATRRASAPARPSTVVVALRRPRKPE